MTNVEWPCGGQVRLCVFVLALSVTGMPGADFQLPAKCSDVWGPFLSAMLQSGFHPTPATSKDAGIAVMEYRSGATAYIDKSLVRTYTFEQPGALTSYQVFGIQQAAATLVDEPANRCRITFAIDFIAYKTSILQTGWLKLVSSGAMEGELMAPVLKRFVDRLSEENLALTSLASNLRLTFNNPHNCGTKPFVLDGIGLFRVPDCSFLPSDQAKFCRQCGANVEGMNFCSRCGHKVN